MHAEFIEVDKETIKLLIKQQNNCIIAVGTTSLRTIETMYWLGVKVYLHAAITIGELQVFQWDPYSLEEKKIDPKIALTTLLNWMEQQKLNKLITKTQIIIAPGYTFNIIKGLITNFHQPQSTLLLLVAAIAGEDWKRIYQHALAHEFRFLSYGDGSLLWV
jgi:S-adenosylmethionine:tRNA ribosyltransferase-isomerase